MDFCYSADYGAVMDIDDDLDATGLLCPLPVLRARKRLKSLTPGQRLRMTADDPAAIIDVPHFCAEQGYTLVFSSTNTTPQIYVIEKT